MWDAHRKHYGRDGDPVLVWQADTRTMNMTVPQRVIDEATERDPVWAAAEYGAQFRSDLESFVAREAVEACIDTGVRERAPAAGVWYSAFVDPSGGSSDSMALAIAHREKDDTSVLDLVRELRPPFNPEDCVQEFATALKSYRVTTVVGDRYAGEWPREQFRKRGISYDVAARAKSDIYRDTLPMINSRRVQLLDHPRLVAQLCSLERRTSRGGRDSIDHPPGAHDDVANSVAGALIGAAESISYYASLAWVG
jgi:hypothetical protein